MSVPQGIDTSRPNIARVYDYWLGGKDNFAADRDVAQKMAAVLPSLPQLARDNRAFVLVAAARAAGHGDISQFLDLGAGLPSRPGVHEVARSVVPSARVLYVDNDPVVVAHSRALLARGAGLAVAEADLADPQAVLAAAQAARDEDGCPVIDLGRPVAVILAAVLHFYSPAEAGRVIAGYASRVAPGSRLLVSAARICDERVLAELRGLYAQAGKFWSHSERDVAAMLGGLEILPPGITCARRWVARVAGPVPQSGAYMLAAAAVRRLGPAGVLAGPYDGDGAGLAAV